MAKTECASIILFYVKIYSLQTPLSYVKLKLKLNFSLSARVGNGTLLTFTRLTGTLACHLTLDDTYN